MNKARTSQEQRGVFILAGIIILLCIVSGWGVSWCVNKLNEKRTEYDSLELERINLAAEIGLLSVAKSDPEKLQALDTIKPASDMSMIEFYSQVRQAAENNGVDILNTNQSNKNVTLALRGGYYSLMSLFADWRTMPAACRISSLRIHRDTDAPALFVRADVTLTAY